MELRLNSEGVHYLVGVPLKDRPELFSQVVVQPGELDWLPPDYAVAAFSTREEAERAMKELGDRLPKPARVYRVVVTCLDGGAEKG